MKAVEILKAARNHVAAPNGWTRGMFTRKRSGAPKGFACCAIGAIDLVEGSEWDERSKAVNALEAAIGKGNSIIGFNDTAKSKKPVVDAFDRAIASLES